MRHENKDTLKAIKDCIRNNMLDECECLSIRSIATKLGIPFQTVGHYLPKLMGRGEVAADDEYGYVLAEHKDKLHRYRTVRLAGDIACGTLNIAEENIDEYIKLPMEMVADGKYFLLRAKGESMINVGIEDGDLVLIRQQDFAEEGEIAVVLSTEFTDSGASLKRYYPEPGRKRIRLHPENDDMKDFYIKHGTVQGVAVKVIRIHDLK